MQMSPKFFSKITFSIFCLIICLLFFYLKAIKFYLKFKVYNFIVYTLYLKSIFSETVSYFLFYDVQFKVYLQTEKDYIEIPSESF